MKIWLAVVIIVIVAIVVVGAEQTIKQMVGRYQVACGEESNRLIIVRIDTVSGRIWTIEHSDSKWQNWTELKTPKKPDPYSGGPFPNYKPIPEIKERILKQRLEKKK